MKSLYALVLLIALQVTYYMAITSVQMVGTQINLFQVVCIKFVMQNLCAWPAIFIGGCSLKLKKQDAYLVIFSGIVACAYTSTFYIAGTFLPAGNMDGICVSFYIIFSTAFDLYKGDIAKRSAVIACIALFGILLLVQPWDIEGMKAITADLFAMSPL